MFKTNLAYLTGEVELSWAVRYKMSWPVWKSGGAFAFFLLPVVVSENECLVDPLQVYESCVLLVLLSSWGEFLFG